MPLALLLLSLGLGFGCGNEPSKARPGATGVEVVDVVSHPSAGAPVGVVYLRVLNHGDEAERLVRATSGVAASAELHETVSKGDMMRMIHHPDGFAIPPRSELILASGGKHIMLTGLSQQLEEGEPFDLELLFEHAGEMSVVVPVRPRTP